MPTATVRDSTIYYEREGKGPTLLFIHGMCGDANVWADQMRRLRDRFDCVAYDRRGHSRSSAGVEDQSDVTHADDARALIEVLGLSDVIAVSSSGGACVALELVRRHPQAVRAAVVSEPPLFQLDADAGRAALADIAPPVRAAAANEGPRSAVDAFFSVICPGLWDQLDDTRKDRYRDNAGQLFATLDAPKSSWTDADLAAITIPILVLRGTISHPSLLTIAGRLADRLGDARLVTFEDSGHVTYAERPDAFEAAVAAFAAETNEATV